MDIYACIKLLLSYFDYLYMYIYKCVYEEHLYKEYIGIASKEIHSLDQIKSW